MRIKQLQSILSNLEQSGVEEVAFAMSDDQEYELINVHEYAGRPKTEVLIIRKKEQ